MFDFAWSELLVIGVVALIVIKPRDLPKVLRTVGYWVRQARQVASEFQTSIEQMARDAELADVKKEIEDAGRKLTADVTQSFDPVEIEKTFNPTEPAAPTIEAPKIEAPVGEAPVGEAPVGEARGGEAPTAEPATLEPPDEPTLPFPEPATAAPAASVEPASVPALEPTGAKPGTPDRV